MRDNDSIDEEWRDRGDEDPADFDQDDNPEEPDLIACPSCHKSILADAERCPRCGHYIVEDELPHSSTRPIWVVVVVVVLIVAMILLM